MKYIFKIVVFLTFPLSGAIMASEQSSVRNSLAQVTQGMGAMSLNDELAEISDAMQKMAISGERPTSREIDLKEHASHRNQVDLKGALAAHTERDLKTAGATPMTDEDEPKSEGDKKINASKKPRAMPANDSQKAGVVSMTDENDDDEPDWGDSLISAYRDGNPNELRRVIQEYGLTRAELNLDEDVFDLQEMTLVEDFCSSLMYKIQDKKSIDIPAYYASLECLLSCGASAQGKKDDEKGGKTLRNGGFDLVRALTFMAMIGDVRFGSLLIEHGARDTQDAIGGALDQAIEHGHQNFIRLILDRGLPNDREAKLKILVQAFVKAYQRKSNEAAKNIWKSLLTELSLQTRFPERDALEKVLIYITESHKIDGVEEFLNYKLLKVRSKASVEILTAVLKCINARCSKVLDADSRKILTILHSRAKRFLRDDYFKLISKGLMQDFMVNYQEYQDPAVVTMRQFVQAGGRTAGSSSSSSSSRG